MLFLELFGEVAYGLLICLYFKGLSVDNLDAAPVALHSPLLSAQCDAGKVAGVRDITYHVLVIR